jgi:hypothetical protein
MREVKAIFEVQGDSDLAGVHFECCDRTIEWSDLTRLEQIRMLNAWAGHHELFRKFVKEQLIEETI